MNLASIVIDELDRLRAMNIADIRSLPEQSHKETGKSWRLRRSVSVYAERVDAGDVRIVVKAFESKFPHVSTRAYADGFKLTKNGFFEVLSEADKMTLY